MACLGSGLYGRLSRPLSCHRSGGLEGSLGLSCFLLESVPFSLVRSLSSEWLSSSLSFKLSCSLSFLSLLLVLDLSLCFFSFPALLLSSGDSLVWLLCGFLPFLFALLSADPFLLFFSLPLLLLFLLSFISFGSSWTSTTPRSNPDPEACAGDSSASFFTSGSSGSTLSSPLLGVLSSPVLGASSPAPAVGALGGAALLAAACAACRWASSATTNLNRSSWMMQVHSRTLSNAQSRRPAGSWSSSHRNLWMARQKGHRPSLSAVAIPQSWQALISWSRNFGKKGY